MKRLLTILLLFYFKANATTYYVSASGEDANNGTSTSTQWQTINKVNSFTFCPGDNILFKRGDNWNGTIIVNQSGTSGNPITYSYYGIGAAPIITGLQPITAWTNVGANLWQSTSAVTALTSMTIVLINGVKTAPGRFPNSGWITYSAATTNTITAPTVNSSTTNWTGADMVIRKQDWELHKCAITNHSGTVITYTDKIVSGYGAKPGNGFYIINDIRTLDSQNEWYFDTTSKKLTIYSVGSPTNVQVATSSNLIYANQKSYITIRGLSFVGSVNDAIYATDPSNNGIVDSNTVINAGGIGIRWAFGLNTIISNNFIDGATSGGVSIGGTNTLTTYNTVVNMGMVLGLIFKMDQYAIVDGSNSSHITHNIIRNTVGGGIRVGWYSGQLVQYNLIDSAVRLVSDAGALSMQDSRDTGRVFDHNIILNILGSSAGLATSVSAAEGIYLDSGTRFVTVSNNTIYNAAHDGIKHWYAKYQNIIGNTTYACGNGIGIEFYGGTDSTRSNIRKHNVFFARDSSQYVVGIYASDNSVPQMDLFDSNYYAKPVQPSTEFYARQQSTGAMTYSFGRWKAMSGWDAHSTSYDTPTDSSKFKFVYNPTMSDSVISLPYTYIDIKGNTYNSGSILIHPFESAVLIMTGTQPPPANNAIQNRGRLKLGN